MRKPLRGMLIDTQANSVSILEINRDKLLDECYSALNCDCIDITYRNIDGKFYDIICDDEGLLKNSPLVSAINISGKPALVGNLFICKNHGCYEASLTDKDIDHILNSIVEVSGRCGGHIYASQKVVIIDQDVVL